MIILKVKEWLKNPEAQFKIKKEFGGEIDSVIRLKDEIEFERNFFYETSDKKGIIRIEKFYDDLMHIEVYIDWFGMHYFKKIQINSLNLYKDGTVTITTTIRRRPRKRVSAKK